MAFQNISRTHKIHDIIFLLYLEMIKLELEECTAFGSGCHKNYVFQKESTENSSKFWKSVILGERLNKLGTFSLEKTDAPVRKVIKDY